MLVLFVVTGVRLTFPAMSTVGRVLMGGLPSRLGGFSVSDMNRAWWTPAL